MAADAPRRRSVSRFGVFLGLSAVLIGAVAAAAGVAAGRFFERSALALEQQLTAGIVLAQARRHLGAGAFRAPVGETDAATLRALMGSLPGVFRLKVYDGEGRIVWSDEPRLVGQRFPDNRYVREALAGQPVTVLERPLRAEHAYERHKAWIAEAYVPVTLPGRAGVVGVIETYRDVTGLVTEIQQARRLAWVWSAAAGGFLYLALALVVWRATVSEERAIARLQATNRDLRAIQRFTEALLRPLDSRALAATIVETAADTIGLARTALYRETVDAVPELLAAWPPVETPLAPGRSPSEDGSGSAGVGAESLVVTMPLTRADGVRHRFVAELRQRSRGDEGRELLTLRIMLDAASVALANAELFESVREAHARLAAIVAGIADRMVIVDRQMRVLWMNAVAAEAAGREPGTVLGSRCFEVFGPAPEACQACPVVRAFDSGDVERGLRIEHRGERVRYLDLVAAPLRNAAGHVDRVLEVSRDITHLVEMEERLRQAAARLEASNAQLLARTQELEAANRALQQAQAQLVEKERLAAVGEVVVGVHHAILNPLTGILGTLRVVRQGNLDPATCAALEEAERVAARTVDLVRRLAALRRAPGTRYVGQTRMLDLERAPAEEPEPGPG